MRSDNPTPGSTLPGGGEQKPAGAGTGTPIFRLAQFQVGVPVNFSDYAAPDDPNKCGPTKATVTLIPTSLSPLTFESVSTYVDDCTGKTEQISTDTLLAPTTFAPNYAASNVTDAIFEWREGNDPTNAPGATVTVLCDSIRDYIRAIVKQVPGPMSSNGSPTYSFFARLFPNPERHFPADLLTRYSSYFPVSLGNFTLHLEEYLATEFDLIVDKTAIGPSEYIGSVTFDFPSGPTGDGLRCFVAGMPPR